MGNTNVNIKNREDITQRNLKINVFLKQKL
jgi:hypothetical protein